MTSAIFRISTHVRLSIGMKVYYDCPPMSMEDHRSDRFFRKYHGKISTVVGFPEKLVGPLDKKGRMPGVYYRTSCINVQFDDEEVHNGLQVGHFVLLDVAKTISSDEVLRHQKAQELPNPILFYQGDTVRESDDLLETSRVVQEVQVNDDGKIVYVLAETPEEQTEREKSLETEREEHRQKVRDEDDMMSSLFFHSKYENPVTRRCGGDQLTVVERGNVFHLYNDPGKMSFTSQVDELLFWSHDGVSRREYFGDVASSMNGMLLEKAREIVQNGEGDVIIRGKDYGGRVQTIGDGYHIHHLHPCFASFREHVRSISLNVEEPPMEREKSMRELAGGLFDDD